MRRVGAVAAGLLRCCHPEPTAAVTLMIAALAVTAGHTAGRVVLIGLAVLTGQLTIGWLNDVLDAGRDRVVGRSDKPIVAGTVSVRTVSVATGVAATACVPLSLACGVTAGAAHLVAVAAGWAYDLGWKSSRLSVLPYVVCFGLLPVFVVLALPGSPGPPWWLPVAGALLGAGAHFANVLPDLDDDAATGVRGLPHRIGATASRAAAALLLSAAIVLLAANAPVPAPVAVALPLLAGVVLIVGFRAGRRPGSRAPFRSVLVVAGIAVALLLASGPALVR
ncbi:MAG TPA: UbiA family prenyltransferase [Pseudonocardia sp.]|nr:UbiA family prenyltransferase [Pseudonocardia sp.]